MATLDFAILAEYAKLDPTGLVTVVGGGFDSVGVRSLGLVQQVHLVLQVGLAETESRASFGVRLTAPGEDDFHLSVFGAVRTRPPAGPGRPARHVLEVLPLGFHVTATGRYEFEIGIDGRRAATVPLDVYIAPETGG